MKKKTYLSEIQKRLPGDIIVQDETDFEFNEDEYLVMLSWIKYFNEHYERSGKRELPSTKFPIISKRLQLDFGLYNVPCDIDTNRGKYIVYISRNGQLMNGSFKKNISAKDVINTWNL
jgi:hypothetical protein